IITVCKIEDIRFHALKAELPSEVVKNFIDKINNENYTKLLQSDEVMFFRPSGQFLSEMPAEDGEIASDDTAETPNNTYPVAAILDGVPFTMHSVLDNRLNPDDPDDFAPDYQVGERRHGTAMASLICRGELDANEPPLTRPVYVRPIMKPDNKDFINRNRIEKIPDNIFFEDIIHRSVKRIFEGEGSEPPSAPTIKIINLSIGDPNRIFFHRLSSCAKLLDWLSAKYQVLFCVSAGNIISEINLGKSDKELKKLGDKSLTKLTMEKINADIRNRRLFAPADSINSLTVGALHTDQSNSSNLGNRIDILPNESLPSPISAHGNGFRNSVKPEIYLPGGRQLYNYADNNKYEVDSSKNPPGQKVAAPPSSSGEKGRTFYTRGTSNAAALATRMGAQIFEVLDELIKKQDKPIPDENIAVIIKTLLVHSASGNKSLKVLEDCLKGKATSKQFKKIVSKYIGYGVPDINRVLECTKQRATVIGGGIIAKDEKHEFAFPLPLGLKVNKDLIRIIITLAWFSPINPDTKKFRKANLSFDLKSITEKLKIKRKEADWRQVKNGTVQHEIIEGKPTLDFSDFADNEAESHIFINVVCREDAGGLDMTKVHYGLAVTFEVSEKIDISIYDQIKDGIKVPVHIVND
ncbi:MAG: S8 family peptidase, partial [Deltaproteobacteria bacterium]|nr:S8 family peptidase [Deltaproteobacteria bacterium]